MRAIVRLAAFFALIMLTGPGARAAELVMVERAGCSWCARWDREVAPIYMKSDEAKRAPLRRVSLDNGQPALKLKEPVRYTPTFLLVEDGQEIGRIIGYLDDSMFWGLLNTLIARLGQPPQGG